MKAARVASAQRTPHMPEGLIGERGKVPLLIAYDIGDDRRRRNLFNLLRAYGEPLQQSVFLCWLDHGQHRRLREDLTLFADQAHGGTERIDVLVLRADGLTPPPMTWIVQ